MTTLITWNVWFRCLCLCTACFIILPRNRLSQRQNHLKLYKKFILFLVNFCMISKTWCNAHSASLPHKVNMLKFKLKYSLNSHGSRIVYLICVHTSLFMQWMKRERVQVNYPMQCNMYMCNVYISKKIIFKKNPIIINQETCFLRFCSTKLEGNVKVTIVNIR